MQAIGGDPQLILPDNTKTAVVKACRYGPRVNRTYAEMAAHYETAILPARPRKPRDRAKVEQAVLIVERWLARAAASPGALRPGGSQRGAIADLMTHLNEVRRLRRLGVTRRRLPQEVDRPTLKALPAAP